MENSNSTFDSSTHSFKFPKLQIEVPDHIVHDWARQIPCTGNMSPPSETHSDDQNLGDSAYEFIDTDTESRDGNATESVASTDFGRPDDVASLADTEHSDDSEVQETGIPSFTGLDAPIQTPTIGQSTTLFLDDAETASTHCIEFEEPEILGAENISVKHTLADFDGALATIPELLTHWGDPSRSVATIRQTMTQQCLSTKDPLRILFVGSHEARQDIIHKIASSVAASGETGSHRGSGSRSSSLFNVVPVSAFGSGKTPEVELMHSSGYQINVEDVVSATNLKFEDEPDKPDVIKLTLDDSYIHHSVPEGSSFIIEPAWELPHVAIFYYSDNDTEPMKRTRTITSVFMNRHHIPSILISHKQLFGNWSGWVMDQHAIHMCLESRDPNGRHYINQRLPIDLASFLKVDSRQMNRNLAYLTGLYEPLGSSIVVNEKRSEVTEAGPKEHKQSKSSIQKPKISFRWPALRPALGLGLSIFLAVLLGSFTMTPKADIGSVMINGNRTFTAPTSTLSTIVATSTTVVSLSTATETSTSTTTITVTKVPSFVSKPNSVAVKPLNELSKTHEVLQPKTERAAKTTICKTEVLGDREVLIRIPSAAKLAWLSKDSISMNITRNNFVVTTERIYSTEDGIILQFSKKDSYGALNITVRTKRQPKINETFLVDFGTTWDREFWTLFCKVNDRFTSDVKTINAQTMELYKQIVDEVKIFSGSALIRMEEANKITAKHAKSLSLGFARSSAILAKELSMMFQDAQSKIVKEIKYLQEQKVSELGSGLERAQVQSKLYWLKIKGDAAQYEAYKAAAEKAIASKRARRDAKKESRRGRKAGKCKGKGVGKGKCGRAT